MILQKSSQKSICEFSALCVIVLVFFYYTILSYTTMVKGCVLCLVRTQRSCAWLLLGCGCSRQRWQWKAFFLALEYPCFSVATHLDLTSQQNSQYLLQQRFHPVKILQNYVLIKFGAARYGKSHNNVFLELHSTKVFRWWFASIPSTDKETDESWDIFIIWKINSGLVWAAGQYCEKKSLGPIMSNFWGPFFYVFMGKK